MLFFSLNVERKIAVSCLQETAGGVRGKIESAQRMDTRKELSQL